MLRAGRPPEQTQRRITGHRNLHGNGKEAIRQDRGIAGGTEDVDRGFIVHLSTASYRRPSKPDATASAQPATPTPASAQTTTSAKDPASLPRAVLASPTDLAK